MRMPYRDKSSREKEKRQGGHGIGQYFSFISGLLEDTLRDVTISNRDKVGCLSKMVSCLYCRK
jgi:hypothetical protein